MDLNKFLDEVFGQVEKIQFEMEKNFPFNKNACEGLDFYPNYSYPPMNVFLTKEKDLVFEMALAGFRQEDLDLKFVGDYMFFSAKPQPVEEGEEIRYLKRRLKLKPIEEQKYYVPEDKFDQKKVSANFKNGLLRIQIPSRQEVQPKEGVRIEIIT